MVDETLMDFAKAFDIIPYKQFVNKLAAYNLAHGLLDWFKDYLSNR